MDLRAYFGNVLVSESEQAAIRKRRDDYRGQLSGVRQELQLAQERISQLLTKEASLNVAIANCYYSVSGPIGRMPNDILCEIFLHCLPLEGSDITNPLEAPVLLFHICRRWRTVATSCPRLWKSLKLETRRVKDGTIALAEDWLERSKPLQIGLQVIIHRNMRLPDPAVYGLFPAIASPISTRLSRLTLIHVPITDIHALPPGSFPCLERLVLCSYFSDVYGFDWKSKGPIKAFEQSPSLQRVAFGDNTFADDPPKVLLPWSQLTHLLSFVDVFPASFYAEYLPQCVRLQYGLFWLGSDDVGDPVDERSEPADFLSMGGDLASLTVDFWPAYNGEVQYPDFFSKFRFPGLRSLRFVGSALDFNDQNCWTDKSKGLFLETLRELENLEYLSLSLLVDFAMRNTFEAILECTPHIITLDFERFDDFGLLFTLLTLAPDRVLVPHLKNIVIDLGGCSSPKQDHPYSNNPEFLNFIKSRRTCEPKMLLERVIFWTDAPDGARPYIEGIQCCIDGGLKVEVRYHFNPPEYTMDVAWMDRDPELEDWREVKALYGALEDP